ncbi:hypothetical protein CALCODRAFT_520525 [Calocera cornea HHB12733]|uniref:Uncharacterized protein n=1 Tax=Calocera cornea HHB12733 TaxID=1353952 RepID=A0A165DGA1_9BASI|nr:hypothetical protein CALCODRAFT_520525 [Calocera cornea HHB12733]
MEKLSSWGGALKYAVELGRSPSDLRSHCDLSQPPFLVPPHWHDYHDEHIKVITGLLDIYRDGLWERFPAGSEEALIRRGVDPITDQPEFKVLFFRDLFSVSKPSFLHVMRAFHDGDAFLKLPYLPRFVCVLHDSGRADAYCALRVAWQMTSAVGRVAKLLGDRKVLTAEDVRTMQ